MKINIQNKNFLNLNNFSIYNFENNANIINNILNVDYNNPKKNKK